MPLTRPSRRPAKDFKAGFQSDRGSTLLVRHPQRRRLRSSAINPIRCYLIVCWNDSRIDDHDASPGHPDTKMNRAARLIHEAVVAP